MLLPKRYIQSYYSPYPNLIFREVFNDEASVRRNGGTPINVSFEEGKAVLTTNSVIAFKKQYGVKSVRIKLKDITSFYLKLSSTRSIQVVSGTLTATGFTSPTYYVNGETGTTVGTNAEIIVKDSVSFDCDDIRFGYNGTSYSDCKGDLFETFNLGLSTEEVSNLYNNTWNKELSPNNLLLDFDSTRGVLDLGDRTDSATATDVSVKKIGQSYSAEFNGFSSKIDTCSDMIGTRAVTIAGWVKARSVGEIAGRVLENGSAILFTSIFDDGWGFSSDVSTTVRFGASSTVFGKWQFVAVTRKLDGKCSLYLGSVCEAPILMGSADQDSGTPVAGTTNVIIGNDDAQTRTFDGNISELKVYEGILNLQTITRYWSSTLHLIRGY